MAVDFRAAFDHLPVPLAVVHRRGLRVFAANRAARELLGHEPVEMIGRPLSSFRDRDHDGAPAGGRGQFRCRRRDGRAVWLEVTAAPLPATDGVTADQFYLLHLLDVTQRRTDAAERTRRDAWTTALGEIRMAVLRGATPGRALGLVCRSARTLLDADDAVVIIPATDGVTARVRAADGSEAGDLVGALVPLSTTVASRVLSRGLPVVSTGSGSPGSVITNRLPRSGSGAVLAVPLRTPEVVMGALCLVRQTRRPFTDSDVAMAHSFADQAASALRIGDLREARERLRVLEDRERIARDLHDSVIQDLFAAGMALDAVQPLITSMEAADRVTATIDQLDSTIKQIRSTIFELEAADLGVRAADLVRRVVDSRAEQLGFAPQLDVDGDLDDAPAGVIDHVLAVISESLSNVARHSGARAAKVKITITPAGALTLVITDDGGGFDPQRVPRGRGLDNMHRRAALLGGLLTISRPASNTGTRVMLTTPPPATTWTGDPADALVWLNGDRPGLR